SFTSPAPAHHEIHTLSLHDALPIFFAARSCSIWGGPQRPKQKWPGQQRSQTRPVQRGNKNLRIPTPISCSSHSPRDFVVTLTSRSEEHTSELQSLAYLVCRLLLEKK